MHLTQSVPVLRLQHSKFINAIVSLEFQDSIGRYIPAVFLSVHIKIHFVKCSFIVIILGKMFTAGNRFATTMLLSSNSFSQRTTDLQTTLYRAMQRFVFILNKHTIVKEWVCIGLFNNYGK